MRLFPMLCLAVALGSCDRTKVNPKGCNRDEDCGEPAASWRCELQTGECFCRDDNACPNGQFCNAAGFCQDRAGCEKNADCLDASLFCDTSTGSCLPVGRCSFDLQCPLGNVCDTARSTCVEGCRSSGDCPGSSCWCDGGPCGCTATTPADLQKCEIGKCDPNFCANDTFCRFGELCGIVPDAGMTRSQCYSDFDPDRRPYCSNCSFGGGISVCGTGANYCLIDTANPGNFFCGTDCSEGQACPRGYECSDVIVISQQEICDPVHPACGVKASTTCMKDLDCPHGGTCVIPSGLLVGKCAGKCAVGEGQSTGYCTCIEDADCAQETCSAGECTISRKKCVGDQDCRPIRCVDFDGVGGCLIGQNCAPGNGLSCVQVGQ